MNVTETLMEMFNANRTLLRNVTPDHIAVFINQLVQLGPAARY